MLCASKCDLFPTALRRVFGAASLLAFGIALDARAPAAARSARAPGTGLRSLAYGRPAPDFVFDAGTGPRRLADLAGRPVVINFWATWCVPCRDELDVFRTMRAAYGDSVALVTITDESPEAVRDFLATNALELPVVEDPARKIFDAYGVTPIPTTIVLRPGLGVAFVSIGELSWPELHGAIDGTLYPTTRRAT